MKGSELANAVAAETKISRKDAAKVIMAAMTQIRKAVEGGDSVRIKGVGRFQMSKPRADGTRVIVLK